MSTKTNRARVARPTERLVELAKSHISIGIDPDQQPDRESRLERMVESLTRNVFRLVVMGEIKKGKSSFINALLRQKGLLPTDVDIATATVFKIVFGPTERVTVFYAPDGNDRDSQEAEVIESDDIWIFGTEKGAETVVLLLQKGIKMLQGGQPLSDVCESLKINETTWSRWNARFGSLTVDDAKRQTTGRIDSIAIELPNPLLVDGIAIIDTPGVGGLFKRHRDVTFRYAPQADVVFFVLDSAEAPISKDEIKFLKELQKNTQHLVFLQTKIDIAGTEQIQSWKKRNLEVLLKVLELPAESIPYFLVGASLKDLADTRGDLELLEESGYPAVLKYVQDELIPKRDEILARKWMPVLGPELVNSARQLSDRLAIARNSHLPEMAEYEKQLQESSAEFDRWQNEVFPAMKLRFQGDLNTLKLEADEIARKTVSARSTEFTSDVTRLRSQCDLLENYQELCEEFMSTWAYRWTKRSAEILQQFHDNYIGMLQEHFSMVSSDLAKVTLPNADFDVSEVRSTTRSSIDMLSEIGGENLRLSAAARKAASATGIGASLLTFAGIISNPVGWMIGAAAGIGYVATEVYSVFRGRSLAIKRQRDANVSATEAAARDTGIKANESLVSALNKLKVQLDTTGQLEIDKLRISVRNDFATRRQELQASKIRTVSEAKAVEEQVNGMLSKYRDLIKQYQSLQQQLETGATSA